MFVQLDITEALCRIANRVPHGEVCDVKRIHLFLLLRVDFGEVPLILLLFKNAFLGYLVWRRQRRRPVLAFQDIRVEDVETVL